jgi:hypothetical protein
MRANQVLIAPRFLVVAFIAAGGVFLMANEASAARYAPQGHASGHRIREFSAPTTLFESYANGRQSYENPDRQLYVLGELIR